MPTTLIVPGLYGSGSDHWQTWLEAKVPDCVRVVQGDWNSAQLPEWAAKVRREIRRATGQVIIVAHGFGCLAAVQAAFDCSERVAGAMLVAPADPDKFGVSAHVPDQPLGFASIVVASQNDPWMRRDKAEFWADFWGSSFVDLGAVGHINGESGHGPWPEGLQILRRLRSKEIAPLAATARMTAEHHGVAL